MIVNLIIKRALLLTNSHSNNPPAILPGSIPLFTQTVYSPVAGSSGEYLYLHKIFLIKDRILVCTLSFNCQLMECSCAHFPPARGQWLSGWHPPVWFRLLGSQPGHHKKPVHIHSGSIFPSRPPPSLISCAIRTSSSITLAASIKPLW